jgi:hypothetical protein
MIDEMLANVVLFSRQVAQHLQFALGPRSKILDLGAH